jgi:hypothetical protein
VTLTNTVQLRLTMGNGILAIITFTTAGLPLASDRSIALDDSSALVASCHDHPSWRPSR